MEPETNNSERQSTSSEPIISHSQQLARDAKKRRILKRIIILVIIVLVAVAYYYSKHPLQITSPNSTQTINEEPVNEIAQEASVSLTAAGIMPATVRVSPGGTVTWTNGDQANHSLVFTGNEDLNSDTLKPKDTYSATFDTAGEYHYHDSANPAYSGIIIVQ